MKYILIISILALLLFIGCNSETAEYQKGYEEGVKEAKAEIASNKLTIYSYGTHPVPIPKDLKDDETGLPIKFIAACLVSETESGRAEGHNKTIREHLKK